jgi:hypothetical protein
MGNSGSQLFKNLTEDDIGDILNALDAVAEMWKLIRSICFKPYITKSRFDEMTRLMRSIEAGLCVAHRILRERRENLP